MPAWGIVLSIVVYCGIGLGLSLGQSPDGGAMDRIDAIVSVFWPVAFIGGTVSWLLDFIFGKD